MGDDELERLSAGHHSWYGTEVERALAAQILEDRRTNNDERLLNLAVMELRQYQMTDHAAVRKIGEDAPFLRKKADAEMWQQPSEEYERLGLREYLMDGSDLTFAALAVAQGRIEDITRLLNKTKEELQSQQYCGLHYSNRLLGEHLCGMLRPLTIDEALALY